MIAYLILSSNLFSKETNHIIIHRLSFRNRPLAAQPVRLWPPSHTFTHAHRARRRNMARIVSLVFVLWGLFAGSVAQLAVPRGWPVPPPPSEPSKRALLPYTWIPPATVPCVPKTKYCATELSNAVFCSRRYIVKVGENCTSLAKRFDLGAWSIENLNPGIGVYPSCRGLKPGLNLCVAGQPSWVPDDEEWNFDRVPPTGKPVRGKTYNYCRDDRNGPKRMALTFDDGPSEVTGELLDLLKRQGIKATFFVNANNRRCIVTPKYAAIVKRIVAEGHQLGTHTASHPSLPELFRTHGAAAVLAEIDRVQNAVYNITGLLPRFFRFPFGEGGHDPTIGRLLASRNLTAVHWTIATNDAGISLDSYKPPATLANSLTRRAFYVGFYGQTNYVPGSKSHIVLMHDWLPTTVRSLVPFIIGQARQMNYTFVTAGECLGAGPADWYQKNDSRAWVSPTICPEEEKPPRCWPWQTKCLAKLNATVIGKPW